MKCICNEILSLCNEAETPEQKAGKQLDAFDKKQFKRGMVFKIILPTGQGEPLFVKGFKDAVDVAKEFGKGTLVVDMSKFLK